MNGVLEVEEPVVLDEKILLGEIRPARRKRTRMRLWEPAWDLFRQTHENIRRNKLRSFLTLFGIAWGIASLVLMSALADGFRGGQRKNMSQIGDNLVFVYPGRTEMQAGGQRAGRRIHLYRSDVEAIRDQCPAVEVVAAEQKRWETPVRSPFNNGRFLTLGVTPEYLRLRNLYIGTGRHISAEDVEQGRRVAVLGHSVRKHLFEERPDVIGQTIRINGYPYLVVGLMSEKEQNSSYDGWDNDKVVIPLPALLRDAPPDRAAYAESRVQAIVYRPASLTDWQTAQRQVKRLLGGIHGFDPEDKKAVFIYDTVESAELFDTVFNSMEVFLAAIALVTLSLGGIGVMNTMMMAVSERTNEIGLRKALGATRRRILTDFFLEGLLLAVLAGVAGFALVLGLSSAVNSLPMPAMFSGLPIQWTTLGVATAALGAVAIFAALPPAFHASGLTPVEALRYER
ncbi:MAG: ABC transporter permease [Bryobacteraceae bacterium]|nr:ABC transporter permease [Bryobacteraceae bacterium]